MVNRLTIAIILKRLEISNHYVCNRNSHSVVGQLYFKNKLIEKEIRFIFFPGFPGSSEVKASACKAGDPGSIPGLGRSPGEGNGNPLQYSCLENPMDRGAW